MKFDERDKIGKCSICNEESYGLWKTNKKRLVCAFCIFWKKLDIDEYETNESYFSLFSKTRKIKEDNFRKSKFRKKEDIDTIY